MYDVLDERGARKPHPRRSDSVIPVSVRYFHPLSGPGGGTVRPRLQIRMNMTAGGMVSHQW
jgi:hypothetical protein